MDSRLDNGLPIPPPSARNQFLPNGLPIPPKKKDGGLDGSTSSVESTPSISPSNLPSGLQEGSAVFPTKENPLPFPMGQPQPVVQTPPSTFTPDISNNFGLKNPTQLAQENVSRPDNAQIAKIPILKRKNVLGENNGDILEGEDEGVKIASDYAAQQKNINTQKSIINSQILNIHQDVATQKGDMISPKLFTPIPVEDNSKPAVVVKDLHEQTSLLDEQSENLRQQTLQKASSYVSKITNDPTTAGLTVRAILGDNNAIQQKETLDRGNPVAPSDMYYNDRQGLEALSAGLDENYKDNPEDPEYVAKKKSISAQFSTLIDKYPEFKHQQLAKIVAQQIIKDQKTPSTTGMAFLPPGLRAAKELGLSDEDIKSIDFDNLPIQTPLSSAIGAVYNGVISLGSGIARIGGSAVGMDNNFLTSELAEARRKAEERFADVSTLQGAPTIVDSDKNSPTYLQDIANPQAGKYNYNFYTVSNAISHGVGSLAQFIGGTRLIGGLATKIAPAVDATEAGMAGLMIGQGYEPYYQKANEVISDKPEDEWKRHAYALINGSLDYYAFKALGNVVRDISPETINEGANIFKSASSLADVNRIALEKWTTKVIKGVKETAGETAFVGGAQAGSEIAKNIVDNVIGNEKAADKSNKELGDVLLTGAESLPFTIMIPVGLSKVISGSRGSYVYKENIYNAGLNPETYLGQANKLLNDGVINKEQYDQRAQVINTATKIVNSIPADIELNHNQRVAYTNSKLRELALKAQVEKVDDAALEKFYNDQIQQEVANRTEILNGANKQPFYEQTTNEATQAENTVPVSTEKTGTTNEAVDNAGKEAGTNEADLISQAKDIVNTDVVKGFSAETLKDAANNKPEDFKNYLSEIAQQAHDENSVKATVDTYGQPLVDIATKLFPKEEAKPYDPNSGKVIVEPSKPISEMNSEEIGAYANEVRQALKKQDKEFANKTEAEKEAGGYYDYIDNVAELRDTEQRVNFVENAENLDDLANSTKAALRDFNKDNPSQESLAILNAAKKKAAEMNIEPETLIKEVIKKVGNDYKDKNDAEFMMRNYLEKIVPTEPQAEQQPIVNEESPVKNYNGIFSTEISSKSNKGKGTKSLLRPSDNRDVVMMSPDDYLTLVREGINRNIINRLKELNTDNDIIEKYEQKIKNKEDDNLNDLSKQSIKLAISKGDKIDMPFIFFDKEGRMVDQDGRNRAAYAKEIGEKSIPVLIENKPISKEQQPIVNSNGEDYRVHVGNSELFNSEKVDNEGYVHFDTEEKANDFVNEVQSKTGDFLNVEKTPEPENKPTISKEQSKPVVEYRNKKSILDGQKYEVSNISERGTVTLTPIEGKTKKEVKISKSDFDKASKQGFYSEVKKQPKEAEGVSSNSNEGAGFTPKEVIDEGYKKIKNSIGQKKAQKYFEQVDRLLNPNENNIVEYRENGVVTKEGDKYTFHALSDMGLKNWRLGFKRDISDQFTKQNPASKVKGVSSNSNEANRIDDLKKELNKKIDEIENPKKEIKISSSSKKSITDKLNKVGNPKVGDVLNIDGSKWIVNKTEKRQTFEDGKYSDTDGYRINITSNNKGENRSIYTDTNDFIKHEKSLSDIQKIEQLKDEYDQKIKQQTNGLTTSEAKTAVSTNDKTKQSSEPTNKVEQQPVSSKEPIADVKSAVESHLPKDGELKGVTEIRVSENGEDVEYGTKTRKTKISVKGLSAEDIKNEIEFEKKILSKSKSEAEKFNESDIMAMRLTLEEKKQAIKMHKQSLLTNEETEKIIIPFYEKHLELLNAENGRTTKSTSEPTNKVENNSKNKQTEAPKPITQSPLPTKEEISKYSAKDKLALVNAVRNKDAKAIQEITERNRGGNVKFDKSTNADAAFETRDGKRIGFDYDTDKVARERFDFSKLKQIGKGSDRTVFDLGDGKVLKVAHTARGLEQNIYEGDRYLKGIVPDVHERGLNYVVTDKVPRIKANDIVPTYDVETGEQNGTVKAGEMIRELGKFNQNDFDNKTPGIQDALRKYGLGDVMDYDVLYGDFKAGRNWGYENGRPVHIDGGTFGGTRMLDNYKGKAPLSDPEFRDIYNKSKALKKQFGDTDKNTKFQKSEIKTDEGTMPVEQYVSRAKAVLEKLFPKAKFEAYDTTADYLDAGGTYGSKGLSRVDGKGNRTIMLDLQEIRDSGSGKTAFHEVIHPIVDEVVGERPEELNPLWNSLAEQMKDVKGFGDVLLHVGNYKAHEHPAAEGITELLTQISEGNISLDAVPPARKGVIIDLLNKLFEKLGLNIRFGDSYDFKSFATDIKKAFETGDAESLKQVVDKKSEENQRAKDNASKISKLLFGSDKADKSETDINDVVKQLRELGLTDKEIEEGLKQSGDSEADIKRALGGGGKSGNVGETEGLGQGDGNAITHAAISEFRAENNFEQFAHTTVTDAELNKMADKAIAKGYNVNDLWGRIAKGHNPNDVETVILKKAKNAIAEAVQKDPSPENLKKALDFANASDIAGQIAGRSFRARQDIDDVDVSKQSLSDFFVTRMRNKGVTPETMTDAQKSEIQKQYKDLKDAHDKLEAKVAKLVEADAKRKAESAVKKMKDRTSSQPKKTHEEYVKERKSLVEQLKAAKAKAEERMKGITKSGFSVTVTPEMVKIIGKIAYSHVSEGAQKLQEVSQKVYNEIKDVFDGVTQQDVIDVLAGAYNAVKPEKNDILKQIAALRSEAIKESNLAKERKDAQRLKTIKKTYQGKIDKLKEDLRTGKYLQEKDKPEPLKLDKEALALKDQYISIKQETQRLIAKDEYNKKSKAEKAKINALEALNIPRTIMSSSDFSAVLRQAVVPSVTHPIMALKSMKGMFADAFSEKKFDRWLFDLKESPLYDEMNRSGVYISDPHDMRLSKKEEAYMNNIVERIPYIGSWLVKGSERAYLSYLNRMRVELYGLGSDVMARNGKTIENSAKDFEGLASFVNNMTGRGGVPEKMELATPLISAGIFAPRLIASRLNLLGLSDITGNGFYSKLPPEVRKMAITDMAKFVMFGSAVLALSSLVGDDKKNKTVELDPRSSDFGKIRVGDTRYDIWGGFQQYVTFFARQLTGVSKSVNNGKIYDLNGKGAFGRTRWDTFLSFARGKASPAVGMGIDFLAGGRTVVGDKILYNKVNPFADYKKKEVPLGSYLANHFFPMTSGDIYDAVQSGDMRNLFAIPATIFGISVQTFNDKK